MTINRCKLCGCSTDLIIAYSTVSMCDSCVDTIVYLNEIKASRKSDRLFKSVLFLLKMEAKKIDYVLEKSNHIDDEVLSGILNTIETIDFEHAYVDDEIKACGKKIISELRLKCSLYR